MFLLKSIKGNTIAVAIKAQKPIITAAKRLIIFTNIIEHTVFISIYFKVLRLGCFFLI